ncbi:MAG: hypothetical protein GY867_04550, partial [bacterium]|nr:hypothetical protein [bacterium]
DTKTAINDIRKHDKALADALGKLLREYRFDILQELFEETLKIEN